MSYVASYLDKMIEKKRANGDLKTASSLHSNPSQVKSSSVSKSATLVGKEVQQLMLQLKYTYLISYCFFVVFQSELPVLLRGEIPTDHAMLMNSLLDRMKDKSSRKQVRSYQYIITCTLWLFISLLGNNRSL